MNRPLSFLATLTTCWAVCAIASAQQPGADSSEATAPQSPSAEGSAAPNEAGNPPGDGETRRKAAAAGEESKSAESQPKASKPSIKPTEPGAVPTAPGLPPGAGTALESPAPGVDGSPKPLTETAGSSLATPAIVLPQDAEAIESKPPSAAPLTPPKPAAPADSTNSEQRLSQSVVAPPNVPPAGRPEGQPPADTARGTLQAEPPAVVGAWVGLGTTIMRSDVFDPFSPDDALTGVALGATLAPPGFLPSGFSVVGTWQYASTEASWRGEATSYAAQRFALGVEVGSELIPRIDYYLRVSAAGVFAHAQLQESSSGVTLEDRLWAVGAEGVAGLQWRIASVETTGSRSLKIFARVEGGLLWLPDRQVRLAARGGAGPVRLSAVTTGDLNMGGDQVRFALGWSY